MGVRAPAAPPGGAGARAEGDDEYLDAVVRETLRVRPVIPAVLRQLQGPLELGRWRLPAGVTVMPAISLMHSDPTVFPEPESFRPERFLDGAGLDLHLDPVRRWAAALSGCRLRQLRDARRAAHDPREHHACARTVAADEGVRNRHITLIPARGARVVRTA